jgi:ribosomal protein L30E
VHQFSLLPECCSEFDANLKTDGGAFASGDLSGTSSLTADCRGVVGLKTDDGAVALIVIASEARQSISQQLDCRASLAMTKVAHFLITKVVHFLTKLAHFLTKLAHFLTKVAHFLMCMDRSHYAKLRARAPEQSKNNVHQFSLLPECCSEFDANLKTDGGAFTSGVLSGTSSLTVDCRGVAGLKTDDGAVALVVIASEARQSISQQLDCRASLAMTKMAYFLTKVAHFLITKVVHFLTKVAHFLMCMDRSHYAKLRAREPEQSENNVQLFCNFVKRQTNGMTR